MALLLPLVLLSACTTDPISPVSDFEFEFGEFDDIDLGIEVDTSTVVINYTPAVEDTTYLENQSSFGDGANTAIQNNERPEGLVDIGQAAVTAVSGSDADELSTMGQQAAQNTSAFVSDLNVALADPNSSESQLAQRIRGAASQHAVLTDLLASSAVGKASGASSVGEFLQSMGETDLDDVSFGILACADDAQEQYEIALARITASRDAALEVITQTYDNNLAKVDAFRTTALNDAEANWERRVQQASDFFTLIENTINTAVAAGLLTDEEESDARIANALVLLINLQIAGETYELNVANINGIADAALATAQSTLENQQNEVNSLLEAALGRLEDILREAQSDCHDQGESNG